MARPKSTTVRAWLITAALLGLACTPVVPLAARAVMSPSGQPVWTPSFAQSVATSLLLGLGVAVTSLAVGLPLGLTVPLYRFPGRSLLGPAQALPLLLPSFLPAIGWSNLSGPIGSPGLFARTAWWDAFSCWGCRRFRWCFLPPGRPC